MTHDELRNCRREWINYYLQQNHLARQEYLRGERMSIFHYNVKRCTRDVEVKNYGQELQAYKDFQP